MREYSGNSYPKPGLWAANAARLQAILIAGRAPEGPIGLLESIGQHGELAAMAQRTGGDARPMAVETAFLREQPVLQEKSQGLIRPVVQVHCSHTGQNSTGCWQRFEQN